MLRYLALTAMAVFLIGSANPVLAQDMGDPPVPAEEEAMEAAGGDSIELAEDSAAVDSAAGESAAGESAADEGYGGGEDFESASNDFLEYGSEFLDDNKIFGKVRITLDLSADIVYDSNIFLNAKDEPDTEGVVDDFILRLMGRIGAVMDVNKKYTKIFKRDRIKLLEFEYIWNKYFDYDEVTNSNWTIRTDLFGFFNDLLNFGSTGKHLYFKLDAHFSDLTDPLDLIVRAPFLAGFPEVADVDQLRRSEGEVNFALGWKGNGWDIEAGYQYYSLEFRDDVFEQANNRRHSAYLEPGVELGGAWETRVYARGTISDLEFTENLLNDAEIWSAVLGLDGMLFTKKIRYDINAGYLNWDPQLTGVVGDTNDYTGGIGWGQFVYKPLEYRKLSFQLEGGRKVDWSAISNFRIDDQIMLTIRDELMPDRLDLDVTAMYSTHEQSEGPRWQRLELGLGLVYHPHRQVDIRLRYLYRDQDSDEDYEIVNTAVIDGDVTTIATDGNFTQHVISLGFEVRF